jgi:hypothetical protein
LVFSKVNVTTCTVQREGLGGGGEEKKTMIRG